MEAALPGAAEALLSTATRRLADRFADEFTRLLADHRATFTALAAAGAPLPAELRAPAELSLYRQLEADLAALVEGPDRLALRAAEETVREALEAGVRLAGWRVRTAATAAVIARTRDAVASRRPVDIEAALAVVALAARADLAVDMDVAQEHLYAALHGAPPDELLAPLAAALGLAPDGLGVPR